LARIDVLDLHSEACPLDVGLSDLDLLADDIGDPDLRWSGSESDPDRRSDGEPDPGGRVLIDDSVELLR
jgi:hypothetical protein